MRKRVRGTIFVAFTILLAMVLTILPLPEWAIWLRPQWLMLVIMFWCLSIPESVSVGIAWLVGLLLDVLVGTLLGQHALALAVVAYFFSKFQPRIQLYPLWQQSLLIFFLSLIYLALIFWVQGLLGVLPTTWEFWVSALTSTLLWPMIFIILKGLSKKFV